MKIFYLILAFVAVIVLFFMFLPLLAWALKMLLYASAGILVLFVICWAIYKYSKSSKKNPDETV